jgi:hypothetical protein
MAQHDRRGKKPLIMGLVAGLTLAGTGVAFAYWTADGTGEGTATTGVSVAFAITSAPAVGDPLSPGGDPQTVAFTVTNPSAGVQFLAGTTVSVAEDDGTPWTAQPGCSAADYTATITTAPAPGEIDGGESVAGTASITMINSANDQDGCQGADVPLYFEAEAAPAAE